MITLLNDNIIYGYFALFHCIDDNLLLCRFEGREHESKAELFTNGLLGIFRLGDDQV